MKRTLMMGVALSVLPLAATAADLPARTAPLEPAPPVFVQVERWSGFYAGVGVGWQFGGSRPRITLGQDFAEGGYFDGDVFIGPTFEFAEQQYTNLLAACDALTNTFCAGNNAFSQTVTGDGRFSGDRDSFVGTLAAGYNWQSGNFVFGVEADISFLNNRTRAHWSQSSAGAFGISGSSGGYQNEEFAPAFVDPSNPVVTGPNEASVLGQSNFWTNQGYTCDASLNPNSTGTSDRWIASCTPPNGGGGGNGNGVTFVGIGAYEGTGEFRAHARTNWLSTIRARAGFSTGPMFLYATGGLAIGGTRMGISGRFEENYSESVTITPIVNGIKMPVTELDAKIATPINGNGSTSTLTRTTVTTWNATRSRTAVGFAVGAGAEWAISPNWSLKGEYVYYNLGTKTLTAQGVSTTSGTGIDTFESDASPISIRKRFDGHIVRVGLNYRFFSQAAPIAPVVARY